MPYSTFSVIDLPRRFNDVSNASLFSLQHFAWNSFAINYSDIAELPLNISKLGLSFFAVLLHFAKTIIISSSGLFNFENYVFCSNCPPYKSV
jgi:hypothetical protein